MIRQRHLKCLERMRRGIMTAPYKEVVVGPEVRGRVMHGMDTLCKAVSATLGPKGRYVILDKGKGRLHVTREGGEVARSVHLAEDAASVGVRLVQEIAEATTTAVGQGSTTATVLACGLVSEGFKYVERGSCPVKIQAGIMEGMRLACYEVERQSVKAATKEDVLKVASAGASGDATIAQLVSQAIDKVGWEGEVTVSRGKEFKDRMELIPGFKISTSPAFVPPEAGRRGILGDCLILMSLGKIRRAADIVGALDLAFFKKMPLLVMAEKIHHEALAAILINRQKLKLPVWAVNTRTEEGDRREVLRDLAIATGTTLFGDVNCTTQMSELTVDDFGTATEVGIAPDHTFFFWCRGKKEDKERRASMIRELLAEAKEEDEKKKLATRLSQIMNGIAVLHVGGKNKWEVAERTEMVEGAVRAARAAAEGGLVAGGGVALLRAAKKLAKHHLLDPELKIGTKIVCKVLALPCKKLLMNAGVDNPDDIILKIMECDDGTGYDVEGRRFVNMIEAGIVDPTRVVTRALHDAAGAANLLTTAKAVIVQSPEKTLVKLAKK